MVATRESMESLPSVRNTEDAFAKNKTINYFGKKQPIEQMGTLNSNTQLVETFGRNYQRSGTSRQGSRQGSENRNYVNESFEGN